VPQDDDRRSSVFISYRREGGFYLAKSIYDDLKGRGYDVFMDLHTLGAGEFETVTLDAIRAREYFVILLTRGSLDRMHSKDDWLRRELLAATSAGRTVVPVLDVGFSLDAPEVSAVLAKLPAAVRRIADYNAVQMPPYEYFDHGLERLRSFLAPKKGVAPPAPVPDAAGLAAAERRLEAVPMPAATGLSTSERTSLSWSELQDRMFPKLPPLDLAQLKSSFALGAPTLRSGAREWELAWTAVPGAGGYVLQRDRDAAFRSPRVVYEGVDTTTYDFSRILLGQAAFYRVRATAQSSTRKGAWSNVLTLAPVKVAARNKLPAPTPSANAAIGRVSWPEIPGAGAYVVQKSDSRAFSAPVVVPELTLPFFSDFASLIGRRPVFYRVKARATEPWRADSDWSEVVEMRPAAIAPVPPLQPPTLSSTGIRGLSWTEVDGATGYLLESDRTAGFPTPTRVYEGDRTSYVDWLRMGTAGKFSYYRVRATSTTPIARESPWSNVVAL
jgi:hypothetical protein